MASTDTDTAAKPTRHPRKKTIDTVCDKLLKSELYAFDEYRSIIDDIIKHVIPFWNAQWRDCAEFASIINKKSIFHEMEEAIPVLLFTFKMMATIQSNDIAIIDLCCGKGIVSMLIASCVRLVPSYQCFADTVSAIYMFDKDWDLDFMEMAELQARNEHFKPRPRCPIKSGHLPLLSKTFDIEFIARRTNIFNEKIIDFLNVELAAHPNCILIGIHLCRRLSVRAVHVFNSTPAIKAFVLAPCCLPPRHGQVIRCGPLWLSTHDLWTQRQQNMDVNDSYLSAHHTVPSRHTNADAHVDVEEEKKQPLPNESSRVYQLALFSQKQINARTKIVGAKHRLNEQDIAALKAMKSADSAAAATGDINGANEMFIASEMLPMHLFALDEDQRFQQWINFLLNSVDCADSHKKMYRVPLAGGQHRCDAYITSQRNSIQK